MRITLTLAMLVVLSVVSSANADLVTVTIQSKVVSENFITGAQSALAIGANVVQRFVYDTDSPKTVIDEGRARFSNALVSHDITIDGMTFSLSNPADISIDNNSVSSFDAFRTSNTDFLENVFINGMTIRDASIGFVDNSQTVFNSTDLPSEIRLADFDIVGGQLGFENLTGNATTYSLGDFVVVPEPSTVPLLMVFFTILCFRRSNAKRRTTGVKKAIFSAGVVLVVSIPLPEVANADIVRLSGEARIGTTSGTDTTVFESGNTIEFDVKVNLGATNDLFDTLPDRSSFDNAALQGELRAGSSSISIDQGRLAINDGNDINNASIDLAAFIYDGNELSGINIPFPGQPTGVTFQFVESASLGVFSGDDPGNLLLLLEHKRENALNPGQIFIGFDSGQSVQATILASSFQVTAIPEPTGFMLVATPILGPLLLRRRRSQWL